MRWFLLFFVLVIASASALDPKSEQDKNKTKKGKQGTDSNPVVVKLLPAKSDESKTAQEQRHEENETRTASATERLVDETNRLVWVTGTLAVFTAFLFGATVVLARDARRTSDRQAGEVQDALRISRDAAHATTISADTTFKAFIAAHRPQIVLRSVYFDLTGDRQRAVPVKCVFVNIGDTEATITGWDIDWATQSAGNPPPPQLYEDEPRFIETHILNSGGQFIRTIESPLTDTGVAVRIRQRYEDFFVHGKIVYEDKLGTRRVTGFCRRYDGSIGSFRKLDGSKYLEYEYED